MSTIELQRMAARAIYAGVLAAVACATGPTYPQAEAALPALAPGAGRLFVFQTNSEVPTFFPKIAVDGAFAGELRPDSFFSIDIPAGPHRVGVHVDESNAAFGSQGATEPLEVPLLPGETVYIEADTQDAAGQVIVHLTRVAPADGVQQLVPLHRAPQPTGSRE
jgi:hypothetical protein